MEVVDKADEASEVSDSEDEVELCEEVAMVGCVGRWLLYSLAACILAIVLTMAAQRGELLQTVLWLSGAACVMAFCPGLMFLLAV